MEKTNGKAKLVHPRKAAAARANGRKGRGPLTFNYTRWNALRHALNARLSIIEGRHLPEYGEYAAMHAELIKSLGPGPLFVEDLIAADKLIGDAWRQRRAFRFELSESEKPDNGMLSPAMANLLRYSNLANRQLAESLARVEQIRQRKEAAARKLAAAAVDDVRGDEQTTSDPAAVDMVSQTLPVSAEPLDTTPATSRRADAVEGEQPQESTTPTTMISASADPGNPSEGTAEEAAHCAAPAEAAQPAPSPAAGSSTTASEEEQKSESPGEG